MAMETRHMKFPYRGAILGMTPSCPSNGWAGPKSLLATYSLHWKRLFVCGVTSCAKLPQFDITDLVSRESGKDLILRSGNYPSAQIARQLLHDVSGRWRGRSDVVYGCPQNAFR